MAREINPWNFRSPNIKGDLFGGITAGIVALPLALAFGVQSGMGATAGLYGAIAIGIIAAILGGTPTQISGPTGPMTVVSATVIAAAIERTGSLEKALPIILLIFFLCGVLQVFMGIFKIGKLVKYIPYPVVSGFMSGIGLIIIILQIFPFFGASSPKTILGIFSNVGEALGNINLQAVILASVTVAIIYLFKYVTKAIPSTLVALIVVTAGAYFMGWEVPKIGDIPNGLPNLRLELLTGFSLDNLNIILVPAITLAALGAIDSLLTSVVADNITKTRHKSNQELIGQGIGNMGAAFIGGIPGAGATMRTVVNIQSGGRSKISGIVAGVLLLAILLGIGFLAEEIPISVLAGILITVGIGIIDYKGLRHIRHVPWQDAAIMIVVLLLTVFVDLLQAVGVGVVLAALFFMKRMSDTVDARTAIYGMDFYGHYLKKFPEFNNIPEKKLKEEVYVKSLEGPLFFGYNSQLNQITEDLPNLKVFVFRFKRVPFIDQSGLYSIEDDVNELRKHKLKVVFTDLTKETRQMLEKVGIIPAKVPQGQVFEDLETALPFIAGQLSPQETA